MSALCRAKCELLIFGYVRQTHDKTPHELLGLINAFFDEYFYWKIEGKEMQKFQTAKNRERLYCPKTFQINDIIFQCEVNPNGSKGKNEGSIQFCVRLKYLPSNIECITVFSELNCETTETSFKFAEKFIKPKQRIRWRGHILKLSECQQFECMDFNCFMEIRGIKYKDNNESNIEYYIKPNKMQQKYKYEWHVEKALIERYKNKQCVPFIYSDHFNGDNWCLSITPSYFQDCVYLKCLSMPIGLKWIELEFKISCDVIKDNGRKPLTAKFGVRDTVNEWFWEKEQCVAGYLETMESICFCVEMKVINLYDDQEKSIKPNNWYKYF